MGLAGRWRGGGGEALISSNTAAKPFVKTPQSPSSGSRGVFDHSLVTAHNVAGDTGGPAPSHKTRPEAHKLNPATLQHASASISFSTTPFGFFLHAPNFYIATLRQRFVSHAMGSSELSSVIRPSLFWASAAVGAISALHHIHRGYKELYQPFKMLPQKPRRAARTAWDYMVVTYLATGIVPCVCIRNHEI